MTTRSANRSGTPWALGIAFCAATNPMDGVAGDAVNVGGSVVATTNYVFRGLSQTDHRAAVQVDVHLHTRGGWFAGAWGSLSGHKPARGSETEVNLYLGRNWTPAPQWIASLHYTRYLYPDNLPAEQRFYSDYDELQLTFSAREWWALSVAVAELSLYSVPAHTRRAGYQWSYEGSVDCPVPLADRLSVTASAGYYDFDDLFGDGYWAWSGGVKFAFERLEFALVRFSVDRSARALFGSQSADGHWALTATWRLP